MNCCRMAAAVALCLTLLPGCGAVKKVVGGEGGGSLPVSTTLSLLSKSGLPDFGQFSASFPQGFGGTDTSGVPTSDTGFPIFSLSTTTDFMAGLNVSQVNNALVDAVALSREGFAQARRLDALYHNYVAVLHALRMPAFFTRNTSSLLLSGPELRAPLSGELFSGLLDRVALSLRMPDISGQPAWMVLSRGEGNAVRLESLWKTGENAFSTGIVADISLTSFETGSIRFAFAPAQMAGLVKSWKADSCADDFYEVRLERPNKDLPGALRLQASECKGSKNALSSFALAPRAGGLHFSGAFAQNVDLEKVGGLRKWMGARQGVLVQAGLSPADKGMKVAAAAAALREQDFAKDTATVLQSFGVAQMATRYFLSQFRKKDASGNSTNMAAYWLCDGTSGAIAQAASENVADLCNVQKDFDTESLVSSLDSVKEWIDGSSAFRVAFGSETQSFDNLRAWLGAVVEILKVRNTMFLANDMAPAYKNPPDVSFAQAENLRQTDLPLSVSSLQEPRENWKPAFRTLSQAELPALMFRGDASSIATFLQSACSDVLKSSLAVAGKNPALAAGISEQNCGNSSR